MIRIITILSAALLTACATQPQTPQQIAARVCPTATLVLGAFEASTLDPDRLAKLQQASAIVSTACGAAASADSIKALGAQAIPLAIGLIQASDWTPERKQRDVIALTLAQAIIAQQAP